MILSQSEQENNNAAPEVNDESGNGDKEGGE